MMDAESKPGEVSTSTRAQRFRALVPKLLPFVAVALIVAAFVLLRDELRRFHFRDVQAALQLAYGVFPAGYIRRAVLVTLPIAAALVGVVVLLPPKHETPAPAAINARPANVVSVEVEPGQHATVFKTKDPTVTVVWLTPGGNNDVNP